VVDGGLIPLGRDAVFAMMATLSLLSPLSLLVLVVNHCFLVAVCLRSSPLAQIADVFKVATVIARVVYVAFVIVSRQSWVTCCCCEVCYFVCLFVCFVCVIFLPVEIIRASNVVLFVNESSTK
jgi:hypothetical protein